ncbi:hypothetical protein AcV5_002178 [Taiwanofungus camphoratus]|nr:hypothetical protein AcV5_002178 [Antrodia cinnamomea]
MYDGYDERSIRTHVVPCTNSTRAYVKLRRAPVITLLAFECDVYEERDQDGSRGTCLLGRRLKRTPDYPRRHVLAADGWTDHVVTRQENPDIDSPLPCVTYLQAAVNTMLIFYTIDFPGETEVSAVS